LAAMRRTRTTQRGARRPSPRSGRCRPSLDLSVEVSEDQGSYV
jgi:hypothetical protein